MNIIILNTNSFGGNYEYSRCLAEAYIANAAVEKCTVVIPSNAAQEENNIFKKILISDVSNVQLKLYKKIYFLFRSFLNPFRILAFLKKQPPSIVIFNDYEQITSFIWVPFFRRLKNKHSFIVILHDPDRDKYLPITSWSACTMKKVMSIMDMALYHEVLPDKPYYKTAIPKINVPHGLYEHSTVAYDLLNQLINKKSGRRIMGVIGNIRDEKNYSLLIDCLPDLPNVVLLIAGSASNSSVSIASYKTQIEKLQVQHQLIWIEKRLTDAEMQAIIEACDLIALYYKHSFTSQSGLLNLIAPHKKKLIVSDGQSALTKVVQQFNLGDVVPIDKKALIDAVTNTIFTDITEQQLHQWNSYLEYASWENHVRIVIENVNALKNHKTERL